MKCPKCSPVEMATRIVSGASIDRCPQCQGYWLDALELETLLKAHSRDLFAEDREAAARHSVSPGPASGAAASGARGSTAGAAEAAAEKPLSCPRCEGGRLIRMSSLHRAGTIVDSCTVCYGIWLDRGELSRLAHEDIDQWVAAIRANF